jgi:hypothetical protein
MAFETQDSPRRNLHLSFAARPGALGSMAHLPRRPTFLISLQFYFSPSPIAIFSIILSKTPTSFVICSGLSERTDAELYQKYDAF